MYLVTQKYFPGNLGGRYLCQVFKLEKINTPPERITTNFAKENNLDCYFGDIVIVHGCGTGAMIIAEIIRKKYKSNCYDLSI